MRESDLIKKIQYVLVSKIVNTPNVSWYMDDVLCVAIQEIIGERPIIFGALRTAQGTYSIKAIYDYLVNRNLFDFGKDYNLKNIADNTKKNWLLNGFYIIESIEKNGRVVLKEILKESVIELGESMMDNNPDMNFYSSTLDCSPRNINVNEEHMNEERNDVENVIIHNVMNEVKELAPQVNRNDKESRLDGLWNEIVGNMGDSWMPYVWKLKISQRQYEELKDLLRTIFPMLKGYGARPQFIRRHALELLVYCAEWYRREYNGNDNNGNAFDVINVKYQKMFPLIYDGCYERNHIFERFRYERENILWLYSMYVLGGLPLAYQGQNMQNLWNIMFSIAVDGSDDDICLEENDLNLVNNSTVRNSLLQEDGSLKFFMNAISNAENLPFAEEDLKLSYVQEAIRRSKEGKDYNLRKKFQLIWMVQYHRDIEYRYRWLRLKLKPEKDGGWYGFISARRLPLWGILEDANNIKSITLGVRFNGEKSIKKLVGYKNNYKGYFVGLITKEYIDVEDLPEEWIEKVDIVLVCRIEDVERVYTIETYNMSKYIQLYPTDINQEWSSKKPLGCYQSAIIYQKSVVPLGEGHVIENYSGVYDNGYNWCDFYSDIHIHEEGGKVISLQVPYRSRVMVKTFPDTINYIDYDKLMYHDRNNVENGKLVQVVFGNTPFCIHYNDLDRDDEDIEIKYVKFKSKDSNGIFRQWTDVNKPEIGMNSFEIDYNGRKKIIDAYYLPGLLARDLDNHMVRFFEMDDVRKTIGDVPIGACYQFNDLYESRIVETPLLIYMGSGSDFVEVPIYQPWERVELLFGNKVIYIRMVNDGNLYSVYPILKNHYNLKVHNKIENLNLQWVKCINDQREVYDKDMKLVTLKSPNNFCDYKLWEEIHEDMMIQISSNYLSEYVFYGWNMHYNTEPERLETEYDYENKILTIKRPSNDYFVFQSLKGENIPPRYWGMDGTLMNKYESRESFRYEFFKNPEHLDQNHRIELQKKCFEIAVEHNIYFVLFKPLRKLANLNRISENKQRKQELEYSELERNYLMEFVVQYYIDSNCNLSRREYQAIWRLSKELDTELTAEYLNDEDTQVAQEIINKYFK